MPFRTFFMTWLPLLVSLIAILFSWRLFESTEGRPFSLTNVSSDIECEARAASHCDTYTGHRWYDNDSVPLSYSRWQELRVPFSPAPEVRSALYKFGARVSCWPSTGGVWIKHAVPLEMTFLDVSKLHDTARPEPYDAKAEDAFCMKMRLIGAEYWNSSGPFDFRDCNPMEKCIEPQIINHLGVTWLHGERKGEGGAHLVNLTAGAQRRKTGPGLGGFYQAPTMEYREDVSYMLGGLWCPTDPQGCEKLWCAQYKDYCDEARHLASDDLLWDVKKKERGFN